MPNEKNDENQIDYVDVNTDNIDDFSKLLDGTAQPAEQEEEKPEETDSEEQTETETETDDSIEDDVDDLADDAETDEDEEEQDDPEANDEADEEPAPKRNNKKTARERINELTAERRTAERERDELLARLDRIEAAQQKPEQTETKETTTTDKELVAPAPTDVLENGQDKYPLGEFDPSFIADLTRHENEVWKQEFEAELAQKNAETTAQRQAETIHTEWQGKVGEASKQYDDFEEKVLSLEEAFASVPDEQGSAIAATIMQMDKGTDVLYYLSNNHDEAAEIASADPVKAAIALGKIEGRLTAKEKPKAKPRVTKTKAPPKVNKGVNSVSSIPVDTDDQDEFDRMFFNE